MSGRKWLLVLLPCVWSMSFVRSLGAVTLDYSTSAKALAEAGPHPADFNGSGTVDIDDLE